ncbi:thiamine biosynthesis lipoprotein [Hydrogenoanaerobacterium saccharovorans]|uniref:FAD:protein FMN transferase n=1 Tax=Hydrogenoanaerobacterium saccharovorans TaxID=474960 RepID=A0A1H7YZI0_9FIRM|nr:FAD:protein FMN transferase [Hydrogenoanaerobacterium saccharovorans]RPF48954.1 thiamine biosynthesis lipoprotein [Hydrogenoanaerobacterium saccharovorans]SEM50657.1 thiamine biosynthesis lipoprotein [Hydrogenoanaerobacterium saccharovorans]
MMLKKKNLMIGVILTATAVLAALLFFSIREEKEDRVDFLMDTFIQQQITGRKAKQTGEKVFQALKAFDDSLSMYNTESEISKINNAAGISYVKVAEQTYNLLKRSQELSTLHNSFDFTIAPITALWHEAKENGVPPTEEQVAQRLALVDYKKVLFNDEEQSVMLAEKGMAIDMGGIAKGYACDVVRSIYQKSDISTALISIGGNVYTYRTPRGKQGYRVGIRNPIGDSADALLSLMSTEQVIATSGAYERFFEYQGISYHHIIDKNTGFPAQSDLLSATIVTADGALADFLSTTYYILGKKAVLETIEQEKATLAKGETPQFAIIAIDKQYNIYVSPSLKDKVELLEDDGGKYRFAV